jgi:hypothetical protein
MRNTSFAIFALALALPLAACGDDGSSDTGNDTGTLTDGPNTSGPSTTDPTPATSTDPTTTDPTTTDPTTTDPTVGDTTAGDSTGGGGAGFCAQTCDAVGDCVPVGGDEADYACTDGFCEFTGKITIPPCDTATCDDLSIGVCADVDGVSTCTTPCEDDTMCVADVTECTGMDDDGNSICAALPCGGAAEGEACEIPTFGSIGTCTDGVCSCTDNAECTADGYACNV